jgi:hypothetical protein
VTLTYRFVLQRWALRRGGARRGDGRTDEQDGCECDAQRSESVHEWSFRWGRSRRDVSSGRGSRKPADPPKRFPKRAERTAAGRVDPDRSNRSTSSQVDGVGPVAASVRGAASCSSGIIGRSRRLGPPPRVERRQSRVRGERVPSGLWCIGAPSRAISGPRSASPGPGAGGSVGR